MKKFFLIVVSFGMLSFLVGCSNNVEKQTSDYFYMDTIIRVSVWTEANNEVLEKVDSLYEKYHNLTTKYQSIEGMINVYYINKELKINQEIEIDPLLYEILEYSKEMYIDTSGKFNIGLSSVIDVWNEYKDTSSGVPSYEELISSGNIDLNNLVLLGNNTIMKTDDIELDLGAISKGYATREVKELLIENGVDIFLINAGGNVVVGNHYDDDRYKIGLEDPINNAETFDILNVENKSIVTSGSYIRNYEYEGTIYHHIIDSETLYPMNFFKSVVVVTDDSALADVLSTYLFTMNYADGLEYVESIDNVEAIWYIDNDDIRYSSGMDNYE